MSFQRKRLFHLIIFSQSGKITEALLHIKIVFFLNEIMNLFNLQNLNNDTLLGLSYPTPVHTNFIDCDFFNYIMNVYSSMITNIRNVYLPINCY